MHTLSIVTKQEPLRTKDVERILRLCCYLELWWGGRYKEMRWLGMHRQAGLWRGGLCVAGFALHLLRSLACWVCCELVTKRRSSRACIGNPKPEQETIKGTHAQETSAYQRRPTTQHGLLLGLLRCGGCSLHVCTCLHQSET